MKKFFLGLFTMTFVVSVGGAIGLGYLFLDKNSENKELKDEQNVCEGKLEECQKDGNVVIKDENNKDSEVVNGDIDCSECEASADEMLTFEDTGMGIEIDYPSSWLVAMNVEMSEEFASDTTLNLYGPVASKYQIKFKNGSAVITLSKILGGVGGMPIGLNDTEYDYEIFEDTAISYAGGTTQLLRYAHKGENRWIYVPQVDCANVYPDDLNGATVCADPFFPGYGNKFASTAVVEGASGIKLEEADEIAKSAANN